MRRSLPLLAIAATVALAPQPTLAKSTWVKKAQELGFKDIQNCQVCHTAKPPELAGLGKWLVEEKTKRKASAIDLAWIRDYKKP